MQQNRLAALLNLKPVTTYSYTYHPQDTVLVQYGIYREFFQKTMWLSLIYKAHVEICRVSLLNYDDLYTLQEVDHTQPQIFMGNLDEGEYRIVGILVRDNLCYDRVRFMKHIEDFTDDDNHSESELQCNGNKYVMPKLEYKPLFTKEEYITWFQTTPRPSVHELYKILKSRNVAGITSKTRKKTMKNIVLDYM